MTDPSTGPSTSAAQPACTSAAWKDGDTMLSFGLFATVVLVMLVIRIADPANWIAVAASNVDVFPRDNCSAWQFPLG